MALLEKEATVRRGLGDYEHAFRDRPRWLGAGRKDDLAFSHGTSVWNTPLLADSSIAAQPSSIPCQQKGVVAELANSRGNSIGQTSLHLQRAAWGRHPCPLHPRRGSPSHGKRNA